MGYKTYDFLLTQTALQDLDEILEYISVQLLNPDAAVGFADAFESKIDDLCRTPELGRPVDNEFVRRDDIRLAHVKNYLVYYIADNDNETITVLRVVLNKRNQDDIVKEL